MTALFLPLLMLALVDSTSFGTLVLPALLVIRRRAVDRPALAIYFATVCGFYFLLGCAILLGLDSLSGWFSSVLENRVTLWLQLVLGVVLAAWGILSPDPKKKDGDQAERKLPTSYQPRTMVLLGLGAAVVEAATMVPYLGAIGMLVNAELSTFGALLILAVYCVVMVLPAIVLIALADAFGARMWPRLERAVGWLEYQSSLTILWVAAIVGLYMAADAFNALGLAN